MGVVGRRFGQSAIFFCLFGRVQSHHKAPYDKTPTNGIFEAYSRCIVELARAVMTKAMLTVSPKISMDQGDAMFDIP